MIRIITLTLFLTLLCGTARAASPAPAASSAASPEGLWLTENQRSVIRIEPCGGNLCGRVFWIIKDGMQTDAKNPDPALRNQPMCDLIIMTDFRQQDATHWTDGSIYKADDGDTYHATLQMLPTGKLLVRGYIGMPLFGKSQTWERASDKDYPHCKVTHGHG